jgi:phosphoribosylglycinamide formyltransferase-1
MPSFAVNAPLPIVVLISGSGTNLQALIDAVADASLPVDIRAVISNRPDAPGLARARAAGLTTETLDHTDYADRAAFDLALRERIDAYRPGLVVLAGFMRILTPAFVNHYRGRLMNIHPSLLPRFRGLDTHARALAAGETHHGASVHFVTDELDGGPVILQARVAVRAGDTPQSLATRVLEQEHRIYPLAVQWFAEGRLQLGDGAAMLDGKPLEQPCLLDTATGTVEACP